MSDDGDETDPHITTTNPYLDHEAGQCLLDEILLAMPLFGITMCAHATSPTIPIHFAGATIASKARHLHAAMDEPDMVEGARRSVSAVLWGLAEAVHFSYVDVEVEDTDGSEPDMNVNHQATRAFFEAAQDGEFDRALNVARALWAPPRGEVFDVSAPVTLGAHVMCNLALAEHAAASHRGDEPAPPEAG